MRRLSAKQKTLLVYHIALSQAALGVRGSPGSGGNSGGAATGSTPQNGICPTEDPAPSVCDNGQMTMYVPQNSEQCAHYECIDSTKSSPSASAGNKGGSSKGVTVVLPAVLGTLFSLLFVGVGVFFYVRRKRASERSSDSRRKDLKHSSASTYNNMSVISRAYLPSQVSYAASQSGYAVSQGGYSASDERSQWRGSLSPSQRPPGRHASIPIYFSDNYDPTRNSHTGGNAPGNRETQLYDAGPISPQHLSPGNSIHENRQWPVSNVVDVKSRVTKPQLVVLSQSPTSEHHPETSASPSNEQQHHNLSINMTKVHLMRPDASSVSPESAGLSGNNAQSPGITSVAAPLTSQMPRLVQIGRPQLVRASGPSFQQPQQQMGSPLRLETTGSQGRPGTSDSNTSGIISSKPVSRSGRKSARLSIGSELHYENSGEGSFSRDVFQATQNLHIDEMPQPSDSKGYSYNPN